MNLVLEYVPLSLYTEIRQNTLKKRTLPLEQIQRYIKHLMKGLEHIHSLGICHRDVKPQNMLIDAKMEILKICDFGSSKRLTPDEPNISYICSRFYRAPEILFGSTNYTTAIGKFVTSIMPMSCYLDIWSAGCVLAEMILGKPLYSGRNTLEQLHEIIKINGTPSNKDWEAMGLSTKKFVFTATKTNSLQQVSRPLN